MISVDVGRIYGNLPVICIDVFNYQDSNNTHTIIEHYPGADPGFQVRGGGGGGGGRERI